MSVVSLYSFIKLDRAPSNPEIIYARGVLKLDAFFSPKQELLAFTIQALESYSSVQDIIVPEELVPPNKMPPEDIVQAIAFCLVTLHEA